MNNPRHTGRAGKVVRHLIATPAGCTIRELIAALEPDCKRSLMWGCVSGLHRAGKVRPVKASDPMRFVATDGALVDRRRVPASKAAGQKEKSPVKPAIKPVAMETPPMAVPARTALSVPRAHRTALQSFFLGVEGKRLPREQLAADVERFLANGGKIQRFQPGESAETIRAAQERYLAKRGRAAQRAQRKTT